MYHSTLSDSKTMTRTASLVFGGVGPVETKNLFKRLFSK